MISVEQLSGFGDALKELRMQARMKQVEVCRAAGMTAPQVSRYENGHEMPTVESLFRYLIAVGADLCALQEVLEAGKMARRKVARREVAHEEMVEAPGAVEQVRADADRRLGSSSALQEIVGGLVKLNLEGMERIEHRMKSMEEWMEDLKEAGLEPRRVAK